MDKNSISLLKDKLDNIENTFVTIEKDFSSLKKAKKGEKTTLIKELSQHLSNIKNDISIMKLELSQLKEKRNKNEWDKSISDLTKKYKNYKNKFDQLQQSNIESDLIDYMNPDAKVNLDELNMEQVMKRGDEINNDNEKRIKNMGKVVQGDLDKMKEVNVELNAQHEKLGNVEDDLKEMDFSLDRARKKITSMFKIYSQDKCIMCMIIFILIIIVTIIIVSACGGDSKNKFNVPHDIFVSKNKTTNSSKYLLHYSGIINYILFLLLLN